MTNIQTCWLDPYLVKLESHDPKGFQELLQEMVKFPTLHSGLAQHSRTPTSVLAKVLEHYKDDPVLTPVHMFGNPNCPKEFIEESINNIHQIMAQANSSAHSRLTMLASNESLSQHDLFELLRYPELAASLAERTNLPKVFFIHIWENFLVRMEDAKFDLNMPVIRALASNPKTPVKILHSLAKYEVTESPDLIKSLLMSNPSLPDSMKAEFALLGFKPSKNVLDKSDTEWFSTNRVFGINGFPEQLLVALANIGHPGGYLRTDWLPPKENKLDAKFVFDLWLSDQSIYKTLWPELRDVQPGGVDFKRWLDGGRGLNYFEIANLDFEHENRLRATNNPDETNYHATQEFTDWLPIEINYPEAIDDFKYIDLTEVAEWGVLDWSLAWSLSNYDSEYISLVKVDDVAFQFIWDQSMDRWYEDRELDTLVDDELVKPYSWKGLSSEKKSFLIEFVKSVYLGGEHGYYQYAEHFLICIALNPHTDDELIDKYFVDQLSDSQLIQDALELRGTRE